MRNTRSRTTGSRRQQRGTRREEILQAYSKSGLTQRVFAREAGIGVSTLQLWLRQARLEAGGKAERNRRKSEHRVSLLEVDVPGWSASNAREEVRYELRLGKGVRLRLGAQFDDEVVRRLLVLQEVRGCSR
jgi:transposase-like protein